MAQHDYDIANQSGANFRADLNNALDAIVSNNSGSSEPSTTFAYEWWIDTSNNLLKLRNSANNAWITLPLSITADNSTSGALTVNGNLSTTGTIDINGQELILDADADTSITADTDDQIDFKIGGTDVATLTNSHLVLKGTTPKITIGDGGEEDTALIFDGNAQDFYIGLDDSADDLIIGKGSTVGTTPAVIIDEDLRIGLGMTPFTGVTGYTLQIGGTSQTFISIHNTTTGNTVNDGFSLGNDASNVFLTNRENTPMIFSTNNTERVRITNNGKVGIGTSSPVYFVDLSASSGGTQFQKQGTGANLYEAWTNTGGTSFIGVNGTQWEFYVGSTLKFQINSSGGSSVSDEKFKENIEDISYGLDTVKSLKPRKFKWKDSQENDIGFIAQEVQPIINEIINEPLESPESLENGMSMNYSALTAVLTKAIQEQQEQIEALQSEINTLKGGE